MFYDTELLRCTPCSDLIRVGRDKDGGYILPSRLLSCTNSLISGGIYTDWSFEEEFISRANIKSFFLVDRDSSVSSQYAKLIDYLKEKNVSRFSKIFQFIHFFYNVPRLFLIRRKFSKKFIDAYLTCSNSINVQEDKMTSLPSLLKRLSQKGDDSKAIFLKLDIEGSEWEIIDDIISLAPFLTGLALEVHDLDEMPKQLDNLINSLSDNGLKIVHVHPNNAGGFCKGTSLPRLLEITFLNSKLFSKDELMANLLEPFHYLHNLDKPCDPKQPEMILSTNNS